MAQTTSKTSNGTSVPKPSSGPGGVAAARSASQPAAPPAASPRRFRKPLDPIGSELPSITRSAFDKYGFHAVELLINWAAIAGQSLARHTLPKRIKWARRRDPLVAQDPSEPTKLTAGGKASGHKNPVERSVLQLWVDQGRAHEIPYVKASILDRINSYFGYRAITDIEPMAGPVPGSMETTRPPRHAPPSAPSDPLDRALAEMGQLKAARAERDKKQPSQKPRRLT